MLISSAGGKETGKCDSRLPSKLTYITVQEFHLQMAPAQAYATPLHERSSVSVNSLLPLLGKCVPFFLLVPIQNYFPFFVWLSYYSLLFSFHYFSSLHFKSIIGQEHILFVILSGFKENSGEGRCRGGFLN